jgi:hypothetical protein
MADVTARKVLQRPEQLVAPALVEAERLKIERVEVGVPTPA